MKKRGLLIYHKIKEKVFVYFKGTMLFLTAGFLCFRNIWLSLGLLVLLPFYVRHENKKILKKRQVALWEEFRNVTSILYSSTAAGMPLEKAIYDAREDMHLSPNRYPILLPEFDRIYLCMQKNMPLEVVLNDFAMRVHDEDISYFVQIISIAKKSGGSLSTIIHHSADAMNMRMEVNSEIETILAGKKGELKVMLIVPPGIILYMNLFSSEYMAILYEAFEGRAIMCIALILYGVAFLVGEKILDITI